MPGGTSPSLRGRIFALAAMTTVLGVLAMWFFLCRSRTEEVFLAASAQIAVGQRRDEVDRVLHSACELTVDEPNWSRYRCRPVGEGICSCAPAMVLIIDLSYAPGGGTRTQRLTGIRRWDVGGLSQALPPRAPRSRADPADDGEVP